MKKHSPTLPAAHIALYGQPEHDTTQEFKDLFSQLKGADKDRCIKFLKALAEGDDSTTAEMRREIEIEQAYLQQTETREQLASDILAGRTPESLQATITDLLNAGGEA